MGFSPNMKEKSCHDVYAKYVNDLFTLYASSFYTWGEGILPIMAYTGRLRRKGYLFQAPGIWKGRDFTRWSIWKGSEICHLGLWKGPEGLTDEFYGFIKSRKRFHFVIDS